MIWRLFFLSQNLRVTYVLWFFKMFYQWLILDLEKEAGTQYRQMLEKPLPSNTLWNAAISAIENLHCDFIEDSFSLPLAFGVKSVIILMKNYIHQSKHNKRVFIVPNLRCSEFLRFCPVDPNGNISSRRTQLLIESGICSDPQVIFSDFHL